MTGDAPQPGIPSISPAEWAVMRVLWERGPSAARDVYDSLQGDRDWAYKTVKTLLGRLVAKGALDYVAVGNAYLYRAAISRDRAIRDESEEFVERVFDGAAAPAALHLLQSAPLDDETIARLRALLDEKAADLKRNARRKGAR